MTLSYHRDKHGNSLKLIRGYRIRDNNGDVFEMATTGLRIPPFPNAVALWNSDQQLRYRDETEIELIPDPLDVSISNAREALCGIIGGAIVGLLAIIVIWCFQWIN